MHQFGEIITIAYIAIKAYIQVMESPVKARLIDVRQYPEYAAGYIQGSNLVPLSTVKAKSATWNKTDPITLICKSGRRAEQARQQLESLGFTSLFVLDGGVDAWRASGKSLVVTQKRPWSMERQVRTTAGALILVTLALAYTVSHYFLLGTTLVGAGLVFAGVTDTCMMAFVLAKFPWNKPIRTAE